MSYKMASIFTRPAGYKHTKSGAAKQSKIATSILSCLHSHVIVFKQSAILKHEKIN